MPNPNLSAPKIHDSLTPNLVKSSKCPLSLPRKPPPPTHPPLPLEAKPRKSPLVSKSRKPKKSKKSKKKTRTTITTTGFGNTHPTTDPENTQ
jgi:hypothetical protein